MCLPREEAEQKKTSRPGKSQTNERTNNYPEEDIQRQIPAGTDITTEATPGPHKKKKMEKSADNRSSKEKNSRTEPIVITSPEEDTK